MHISTVLFDLDGTLLPMDQDAFIRAYFGGLAKKMAPHGYDPKKLMDAVWTGTAAMVRNDGRGTNEDVFWQVFESIFGEGSRRDAPLFREFYETEFQNVKSICGCNPQAAEIIRSLKDRGLRVALATNPLFPAIATQSRVRWAGLKPEDFDLITVYENSRRCKPNPDYYRDVLSALNVQAEECLMVGNDVDEDMIAETLGMKVFLLTDCLINKHSKDISAYPHGGFTELSAFLKSI